MKILSFFKFVLHVIYIIDLFSILKYNWGADIKSLQNIYKSLILSQINNDSQIYSTAEKICIGVLFNEGIGRYIHWRL